MAYLDRFGLGVICLRGLEQGIPRKAKTPHGATLFFRGAVAMDPGARLVAVRPDAAGAAVQPLVVPDVWPSPGSAVTLVWCEAASATPAMVRGTLVRACRGEEAVALVSDASAAHWLAERIEPLLEVDADGGPIPAGAVALNDRHELVGVCMVARTQDTGSCFLLPGPELNRLLGAAQAMDVRPLDEFSEDFAICMRAEREALGMGSNTQGALRAGMAEMPGSGLPPGPALGPTLEAAFAAGELAAPPVRFLPLRVDDGWTITWEDLYDAQTIRSRLAALPCGRRLEVLAGDNPGVNMNYIGHVQDGRLHGWAAVVSADGILRLAGGFNAGQSAGPCWCYDEQGRLVLWVEWLGEVGPMRSSWKLAALR